MASFLARALRYLSTQYQISGSEVTTNELDLSAVQLVQDVSHPLMSGRGMGRQDGWAVAVVAHTFDDTAAPSTPTANRFIDPYDPDNLINASGVNAAAWDANWNPDHWDIWLYGVGLTYFRNVASSTIDFAHSYLMMPPSTRYVQDGSSSSTIQRPSLMLQSFRSNAIPTPVTNFFIQRPGTSDSSNPPTLPLFIPRSQGGVGTGTVGLFSYLQVNLPGTDDGTLALTVYNHFYLRVLPRGLAPS